jgi:hypothetical protein
MNRIILIFRDKGNTTIEAPIQEDFQIDATTEFTSFSDLCPSISSLTDLANTVSVSGGTVSKAGLTLRSIIDAQRWTKTNPIKINLDMFFYTQEDAKKDVVDKINLLLWTHILKYDDNNRILVPGINAQQIINIEASIKGTEKEGMSDIQRADASEKLASKEESKLENLKKQTTSFFSVIIPGIVYLDNAFMFAVKPTYSKQVTAKGYPLWASVNVDICGVAPAFLHSFEQGSRFFYSRLEQRILDAEEFDYLRGL